MNVDSNENNKGLVSYNTWYRTSALKKHVLDKHVEEYKRWGYRDYLEIHVSFLKVQPTTTKSDRKNLGIKMYPNVSQSINKQKKSTLCWKHCPLLTNVFNLI